MKKTLAFAIVVMLALGSQAPTPTQAQGRKPPAS